MDVNNAQPPAASNTSPVPATEISPQSPPKRTTKSKLTFILGGILLLVLVSGGSYYLGNQKNNSQAQLPAPSPSAVQPSPREIEISTSPSTDISTTPESKTTVKAILANTTGWKTERIDNLSIKVPAEAVLTQGGGCDNGYVSCYLLSKHDPAILGPLEIPIKVKPYTGGSRRLEAKLDLPMSSYTFTEKTFGEIQGLEAVNKCEIPSCTSLRVIILVVGNKLIKITDAIYKDGSSSTLESTITNAVAASITDLTQH